MDTEDYWSIDSILADNQVSFPTCPLYAETQADYLPTCRSSRPQKLPCTFALDVPNLGYLDGSGDPDVCPRLPFPLLFLLPSRRATSLPLHFFPCYLADQSDDQTRAALLDRAYPRHQRVRHFQHPPALRQQSPERNQCRGEERQAGRARREFGGLVWVWEETSWSVRLVPTILKRNERRQEKEPSADPSSVLLAAFLSLPFVDVLASCRLDDPQSTQLSNLLSTTFRFRLPEIQDQAHHAASITSHAQAGLGGGAGDFREGMEGEERECQSNHPPSRRQLKRYRS